jgi:hypothetical protein
MKNRFTVVTALGMVLLLGSTGSWAAEGEAPAPEITTSPAPAGKSVGTKVRNGDDLGTAVGVRPLDPGSAPGVGSNRLGAGAESSIGAGIRIPLPGTGPRNSDKKGPRRPYRSQPERSSGAEN